MITETKIIGAEIEAQCDLQRERERLDRRTAAQLDAILRLRRMILQLERGTV